MPPPTRTRRSPWGLLRRITMCGLAAFALAGMAFAALAARLEANVREGLQTEAMVLGERLGRKVAFGQVEVSLGLTATASVHDLAILPAEGASGASALPLLKVSSVGLQVAVLPLLLSRGRELEIVSVEVQGPEVTIVRRSDGTLSTDDVRARAAAAPTAPPSARSRRLSAIDRLTIHDGALRFFDGPESSPIAIESIHAEARAPRLDDPLWLVFEAASLSRERNVHASILLGPPRGLATDTCPLRGADLRFVSVPLAPIAALSTTRGVDLSKAALSLEAQLSCKTELHLIGSVTVAGLRVGGADAGEPSTGVDAHGRGEVVFDSAHDTLEVSSFEVEIGSLFAKGQASLRDIRTKATLRSISIEARADAEQLPSFPPAFVRARDVELRGPIAVNVALVGEGGELHGPASARVEQARVLGARTEDHPGEPTPVDVRGILEIGPGPDSVALRAASLRLGEHVHIDGSVAATDLRAADVSLAISLVAKGRAEDVVALAPPSRRSVPGMIHGPFEASVRVRGTRASLRGAVRLDLTESKLAMADFVKASGVPMTAEARGALEGDTLRLEWSKVRLASTELRVQGTLRGPHDLELRYDADTPSLAELLALHPVPSALPARDATLDGHLRASGSIARHGELTSLSAHVTADDVRLSSPKVAVSGHGDLSVHAAWQIGDARVEIRDARWIMPGLVLAGGTLSVDTRHFEASAESLAIDISQLSRSFREASGWPEVLASAQVAASAHVVGDSRRPWEAKVQLHRVGLVTAVGTIRGEVELDGVSPPRKLTLDLVADTLNLGDLGGLHSTGGPPPSTAAARARLPELSIVGRAHIGRALVRGLSLEGVAIDATFADGALRFRELRARALGGALDGSGSRVELRDGVPHVSLRASLTDLDLGALSVPAAARVEGLRGRAAIAVQLDTAGASSREIAASARGSVRVALRDVHLETEGSLKAQLVNPLLARASARASQKHVKRVREVDVKRASASFRIDQGAAITVEPMRVESEEGTLTLSGRLAFDKTFSLRGALTVPPSAVDRATDGRLVPLRDLTIRMTVVGSGGEPRVQIENLAEAIRGLRGSLRNAIARRREGGPPR